MGEEGAARSQRASRAYHAGLDRAAVLQAAAALADRDGLAAVTLGSVAAQLGVRTASLYNHISGLAGLHAGLGLLGLRELGAVLTMAAVGKSGDAAILALADAYRQFVHAHPGLYAATMRAELTRETPDPAVVAAEDAVVRVVLAVLGEYRLDPETALHAVRGLRSAIHGFVSLELVGGFGLPLDRDASFHWLVQAIIAGLHYTET
jgi:AcrR family transcriptional regulator